MNRPYLLAVDDEPDMAVLVAEVAELEGYEAQALTSGPALLAELAHRAADVIVLDVVMPEMDGIELCRRLAERQCAAALVLISGYDGRYLHDVEALARAHQLRVAATLTKPLNLAELRAVLRALAGRNP
ncbi:MAG TPA: response regulator [Gemmatimonadales bacterium]|jgi:two-component system response regulator MprA|nr:response regulator [Gemmatimonadales bacterium]